MSGEIIKADKVLNIGQRVEFYLENDDTRYTSRIEDITQDSLVVAMPVDEKRRPIIPREGERLYGKAVTKTCAYRFFTVFKTKAAEPIPVWHIVKPVTVERSVPDMDYVVESGNRLWGCRYGVTDGKAGNEIYASKLGDFKNWNCYAGRSTDSYAATRGSDGPFTGAADYLGSPLFFKENCVERVYPSANGAHQIVTVQCPGVKDGSGGSLQVVDGKLYYHSQGGVCVFDGSMPVNVSQALGEARYHDAVAGAAEGCYYLSAADEAARNNERPETQDTARRMRELLDDDPVYRHYDWMYLTDG